MNTKQLIQLLANSLDLPLNGEEERLLKLIGTALLATGGALMAVADAKVTDEVDALASVVGAPPKPVADEPEQANAAKPEEVATADPEPQPEVTFQPTVFDSNTAVFEEFRRHLAALQTDDLDGGHNMRAWLKRSVQGFGRFKALPDVTKRAYLELLVAMARAIEPGRFLKVYGLSQAKQSHVDAYVHGLATHHQPRHKTWLGDANALWSDFHDHAASSPAPVVRKQTAEPAAPKKPTVSTEVLAYTRGKVLAIVGGHEKAHARDALIAAFELKELRWVPTKKKNQVQKAMEALANDTIDLAIVTVRFTSHTAPAQARSIDPRRVIFTKAYGVVEVEQAILEWLRKGEKRDA